MSLFIHTVCLPWQLLLSDQYLARSSEINLRDVFVFHPLFPFRLVMKLLLNLKREQRGTIVCTFMVYIHGITLSTKNSSKQPPG